MKNTNIFLIIVLMLVSFLNANSMLDNLRINGFVSQGYIYSQENDYLVKGSQGGSSELNELGFTLSKQLSPKLRVGFQLLSRDYGELGNNETKLDWAFADYRWKDYLGFRFGKVKTPLGLYNEGRDVDMLRPTVFLPQSVYDEAYRSYLVAYQGVGLYGSLPLMDYGDLEYNGFLGNMNLDKEDLPMRDLLDLANGLLSSLSPDQTTYIDMLCEDFHGASIFYNSPYYFRVGYSFFNFNGNAYTPNINIQSNIDLYGVFADPTDPTTYTPIQAPIKSYGNKPFELEVKIPNRRAISFEFQYENFTLATEYLQETLQVNTDINFPVNYYLAADSAIFNTDHVKFDELYDRDDEAFYVMASYTFFEKYTLSGIYDHIELKKQKQLALDANNKPFLADMLPSVPNKLDHRTDIGLGIKYDVNFNWTIKAEYHAVDGIYRAYSDLLEGVEEDTLEKDWSYMLTKVSFNF
jgi:hypothetical protein